ncbi:MAG: sugar ABC transporter substrate-binding protein, partial [Cypionkella sp.]|nr:sugar ABC transporter substrate-binding protein [Cypionkella sp.]
MTKTKLIGALMASTLLASAAYAEDVTLTIESWRNDDVLIWQDTIIPAFEVANPGI